MRKSASVNALAQRVCTIRPSSENAAAVVQWLGRPATIDCGSQATAGKVSTVKQRTRETGRSVSKNGLGPWMKFTIQVWPYGKTRKKTERGRGTVGEWCR